MAARSGDNWREDDGSYELEVFAICDEPKCRQPIYMGEEYFDADGIYYCEKCFQKKRKVAEPE